MEPKTFDVYSTVTSVQKVERWIQTSGTNISFSSTEEDRVTATVSYPHKVMNGRKSVSIQGTGETESHALLNLFYKLRDYTVSTPRGDWNTPWI